MTPVFGRKTHSHSVRHVYDDSGEPSGLLLLCHCRHCFHPRWALAVAFRRPLACCPSCAIGGLRPSPHRTTAHAMPTQRSRSSPPHAHRCPTPGIRAELLSPLFRIASNPQDRLPSPTRRTTPRHPSHVGFSQTCAVPLDTPTPCFPNRKWVAKEPLEGKRGALAAFRISQTRVRPMAFIHRHWPTRDPSAFVSGALP